MPARPDAGATRALAWLYSSGTQRPVLSALGTVEGEVGASLAPGLEHGVAHARLAWWREECARTVRGQAEHPATRELQQLFTGESRGALAGLTGFVDTATWDLAGATFETRRELSAYCARWSAALIGPYAAFSLHDPAPAGVDAFGSALHQLQLLCALSADARLGRVRIPLDELDAAGVRPGDLGRMPWTPALAALVRSAHLQARAALAHAVRGLRSADQPALRALLVWAQLLRGQSRRISAALPGVLPAGDHHAALDGWRAWRAARRAGAGAFTLPAD